MATGNGNGNANQIRKSVPVVGLRAKLSEKDSSLEPEPVTSCHSSRWLKLYGAGHPRAVRCNNTRNAHDDGERDHERQGVIGLESVGGWPKRANMLLIAVATEASLLKKTVTTAMAIHTQ